jgi:predicted permease
MERVVQDLRFAVRTLRKSPGFATAAALTLALGIGANTAIFSLIDAVLLRALPVRDPDQLVILRPVAAGQDDEDGFSVSAFEQIRDHGRSLSGAFAFDGTRLSASVDGRPDILWGQCVSGDFFELLGVKPTRGRAFTIQEDQPASSPAAVISYAYWKRRFALDPGVVGKTITIKGVPFTLIGVAPEGFAGIEPGFAFDVWVPLTHWTRLRLNDHLSLGIMGRLRPGVAPEKARAEIETIYRRSREKPQGPGAPRAVDTPPRIELQPGGRGLSGLREDYAQPLTILMAVVAAVLLIACANVANLVLARSSARRKEIAVRLAMGASRGRLIRQLLTESVLLASIGGLVGLLLAAWGSEALLRLVANGRLSGSLDLHPDLRVLAFTSGISIAIGILFGLMPALRATSMNPQAMLKDGSQTVGGDRRGNGVRAALVVTQVSLCVMLLVAAGLLGRSLQSLFRVNPGFEIDRVLLVSAYPTLLGYEGQREIDLYARLQERLLTIPGVRSASLSRFRILYGGRWERRISVRQAGGGAPVDAVALCSPVSPGFFETMGIPILVGRDFQVGDGPSTLGVTLVTESFARAHFPGVSAVGEHVRFTDGGEAEVVGVVRDVKSEGLRKHESSPTVYIPIAQTPADRLGQITMEIRTNGHAAAAMAGVQRQIQTLERDLPLVGVETQQELVAESVGTERLLAALCSSFALLALVLACVGLYGVLAYSVAQRTREIGIRFALGARPGDLLRLVLGQGVRLASLGIVIGLAAAPAAARVLTSMLFGVGPADPLTLAGASLALLVVSVLACYVPARRAMRVDPLVALRSS